MQAATSGTTARTITTPFHVRITGYPPRPVTAPHRVDVEDRVVEAIEDRSILIENVGGHRARERVGADRA